MAARLEERTDMQPKNRRKLALTGETLRTLTLSQRDLLRVVGGISGPRGCHTIDDICGPGPGTGVTCNPSGNQQCPSGNGGTCGESMHSIC
jgi:hypothetical protein